MIEHNHMPNDVVLQNILDENPDCQKCRLLINAEELLKTAEKLTDANNHYADRPYLQELANKVQAIIDKIRGVK